MELAFQIFGPGHLVILALTAAVPAALVMIARSDATGGRARAISWGIVAVLLLNKIVVLVNAWQDGVLTLANGLPMHLCDWATFAVVATLIWRWQTTYEMAYFWGLAGTLQAILTPDLAFEFPDVRFITFFVSHCGVVAAAIFMTLALRMRPHPRSLLRVIGWSNVYLLVTLLVNFLFDANYGYLCAKPVHPSLLDHLGPWPWYILSLEGLALVFFIIFYFPFFISDQLARSRRG